MNDKYGKYRTLSVFHMGMLMDESILIILVSGVAGLLALLVAYRFISRRRQLSSGRVAGRFTAERRDGQFIFEDRVGISTRGKWCRVLLTLKSAEASRIQYLPKSFFEKTALLVGVPYTLTLRDPQNRPVHTEERSLEPFVAWLGGTQGGTETTLGERSAGGHQGTVTLLEFLPREAGDYSLSLRMTGKVEAQHPGSSSTWEVLEAEITVMEDVIPLSATVSYPHQRVCL